MASTTNDSFDAKGTEYRNDLEQRRSHNPNGDLGHESRQIEPQSKGFYGHIVRSSPSLFRVLRRSVANHGPLRRVTLECWVLLPTLLLVRWCPCVRSSRAS